MNPKPFSTGYLDEKDGHRVYYARYGNPEGEVVVVLHGGPGAKSKAKHVVSFDLDKYQVVTFDQRGCGESTPLGELKNNTIEDLVMDMERLRTVLGVDKWFVAGGSWGATLALVYAETHADKVKGLLLSSVFLGRKQDVEWAFTKDEGVVKLFPDLWEKRLKFLGGYNANPKNAAEILLKMMQENDESVVKDIVAGVMNWEGNLMNAQADLSFTYPEEVGEGDIDSVKIFLHYESNSFFLESNQLLNNLDTIKSISTVIVHGRYDVLCPADQVWELQKGLDDVEVVMLPTSNHRLTAEGKLVKKWAYRWFLDGAPAFRHPELDSGS